MAFPKGRFVRVVNRVVDKKGQRVPHEAMLSGEAFWIRDSIDLPLGEARTVIHNSMYKMDPISTEPSYKLGCTALGVDTSDLPVEETQRQELIDRDLLPESQKKKMKYEKIHNPINPGMSRGPLPIKGNEEGSLPGEFGFRD